MAGTANFPLIEPVKAQGFYSFTVTIPDDDVYSFTPAGSNGHLFVSRDSVNHQGIIWYRASASNPGTNKLAGGPNLDVSTSALTGTTGVDGNTTVSTNGGLIYIENRTNGSGVYTITLITSNGGV